MRKVFLLATMSGVAIGLTALFAMAGSANDTFPMGLTEMPHYDLTMERSLTGVVGSVAHPDETRQMPISMMFFIVKTPDKSFTILLGPRKFVERSGFALSAGDTISLLAAPALVDGKQILLAREVSGNDEKLVVRNERGEPLWMLEAQFPLDLGRPGGPESAGLFAGRLFVRQSD